MFGEMYITDGTKDLYVYGVQGEDGTHFDKLEDQPEEGDEVVLYGPLQVYKDKPELKKCKLMAMTHAEKEPLDLTKYAETTIATTRTKEKGSKVMLNGVVGFTIAPSGLPKVMVPVIWFFETISLMLRLLTLAVRLYGNMFAGHMVLGIFALASSVFLTAGIQGAGIATAGVSIGWFAMLTAMYLQEPCR